MRILKKNVRNIFPAELELKKKQQKKHINKILTLREKCPFSELFSPNAGKYGPE